MPTSSTNDITFLKSGLIVVNGSVPTAAGIGLPLHLVPRSGEVVRSFGSATGAVRPGLALASHRVIAPSGDRAIWAAHRTQYVIERWGTDGVLQRQLVRQADWFDPYLERPIGGAQAPPPIVVGIREISPGRVMVVVGLSKPDYVERRGPPVRISERGNPIYDLTMKQDLYDTIVEVIDVESNRLLLSQRVSLYTCGFVDDEHLCSYRADDQGVPFVDVVRVRFIEN